MLPILGYIDFTLAPSMDDMAWICQTFMYTPSFDNAHCFFLKQPTYICRK